MHKSFVTKQSIMVKLASYFIELLQKNIFHSVESPKLLLLPYNKTKVICKEYLTAAFKLQTKRYSVGEFGEICFIIS